jgi:hypothetical protein
MSKQEFFIEDQDWAKELESDYMDYQNDLELNFAPEEELEEHGIEIPDTLSGEPFCGCTTCYTREQLFFLVPRIIKAYKEGKITLNEE